MSAADQAFTPLAREEMAGPGAEGYRRMIENPATGRPGTTDEIATAAALLLGEITPAVPPTSAGRRGGPPATNQSSITNLSDEGIPSDKTV